jgi:hypothetical protein
MLRPPTPSIPQLWRITSSTARYGVRAIRTVLEAVENGSPAPVERAALEPPRSSVRDVQDPGTQLDGLLARSVGQSTTGSRLELYEALLGQLVPDEARILAALSDGGAAAVVHVIARSRRSGPSSPLIENASSVGRTAGVALPEMVPVYVTHLLQLGLVELRAEDDALKGDYELVMTETSVRDALSQAGRGGVLPPRVTRQTLQLSELGRSLWASCRPGT